jgi:hypothetical protein
MPKRWGSLGEALQCVGGAIEHAKQTLCAGGFAGGIPARYVREDGGDWPVPRADWRTALEIFDWGRSTTASCSTWPLARHLKDYGYEVQIEVDLVAVRAYIAPAGTPAQHGLDPQPSQLSLDELVDFLRDTSELRRADQRELAVAKFGWVEWKLWNSVIKKVQRKGWPPQRIAKIIAKFFNSFAILFTCRTGRCSVGSLPIRRSRPDVSRARTTARWRSHPAPKAAPRDAWHIGVDALAVD